MLTLLGALLLVGFITGIFRVIFWPFPLVGILIMLLLISSIVNASRRRAHNRRVQRQQNVRYKVYQPTENPFWKNHEAQVVQEQEQEQVTVRRVVHSTQFCDFCGMKVNEKMMYCTNCGNHLH